MSQIPKSKLQNILRDGRMMSNICFNLSQGDGSRLLSARERQSMKECYQLWDKVSHRVNVRRRKAEKK